MRHQHQPRWTLIREHATPATTTMPRVASSDRLRRSICSNGLGVPKAKSAATHTPSLPATSSSGATREGLSAGRLNARASTRMGRGTSDLMLPAALRLLRRLAESQLSVQLQAVMHLYIYTPRAEQRAPQAAQPSPPATDAPAGTERASTTARASSGRGRL